MKLPRVLRISCCAVLLGALGLPAASGASTRKKKPDPTETEDDDKPAASPTPAKRKHHPAADDDADATPAPTPAPAGKSRKDSSADEAAVPPTTTNAKTGGNGPAATSSIEPGEIAEFDAQPEPIRKMLSFALDLTKRNLTYAYGSADPGAGGMDCSGTIYYLLKSQNFGEVPRQANEQYEWVRKQSRFYAVLSKKQDNAELTELRPGDLLFWTGTYNVDRDPPVTHVMIYLGKRKKDGKRLMFGSSDGRPYDGQKRNGVSVFDFKMPAARSGDKADAATAAAPDHSPDFAGYGPIPGMAERADAVERQTGGAAASKTR